MTELTLSTPSILFSAISLILLAYTNRFLSYAQLVRTLKADYDKNPSTITHLQLANLRRRLYMARSMQLFGVSSLLLCVVCTFLIYIGLQMIAVYTFGIALVLLTISLGISIRELLISVRALELHLDSFERMKTLTATSGREGNIETPRRRKGTSEEHRPASVPTDQSLRTKKPAKGKTKKEESNKRVETKAHHHLLRLRQRLLRQLLAPPLLLQQVQRPQQHPKVPELLNLQAHLEHRQLQRVVAKRLQPLQSPQPVPPLQPRRVSLHPLPRDNQKAVLTNRLLPHHRNRHRRVKLL